MFTDDERERFIQLLGMIGSKFDGEILNAARLAQAMLVKHRLTVREVLGASAKPNGDANRAATEAARRAGFEAGLKEGARLTAMTLRIEYDKGFADGIKRAREGLTPKNRSWKQWSKDRLEFDQDMLTSWETDFFSDFVDRFVQPTVRQAAIFARVAARLGLALPESPIRDQSPDDLPF